MKRFWSLLYHEFRLSRKSIVIRLGLLIFWAEFIRAIMLSVTANGQSLTALLGGGESLIVMTALICVVVSLVDDVFKADLKSGWLIYSYVLPVTTFERAAVRFVRRSLMCAGGMAFSLVNAAVVCAVFKVPFECKYIVDHIIVLDSLLVISISEDFFMLSARDSDDLKKATIRSVFTIVGFYAVVGLILLRGFDIRNPDSFKLPQIGVGSLVWALPLMILLMAASFAITYKRLGRAFDLGMRTDRHRSAGTEAAIELKRMSDGMTGLLYKEFRQNRLLLILVIVVPFLLILFPLCVTLYFINAEETLMYIMDFVMRTLMIGVGFFIFSGIMSEVFKGDDKKLWAYFVASNPKGIKGFLYYKYVLVFAMNGLYMAAGIFADALLATISYYLTGRAVGSIINVYIAVFYLLLLLCAVDIPFIIRFGARKGSFIKTGIMLLLCVIGVVGFAMLPESISDKFVDAAVAVYEGKANNTLMLLLSLFPYIALAAFIGSYRFSCRIFMKGVTEYDG